jgi:hypothetical protein
MVSATAVTGCDGDTIVEAPVLEAATPRCELRLELPTVVRRNADVWVHATIKNTGSVPATLVLPGDGSMDGWRTPVVGWSMLPADSGAAHPNESARLRDRLCGMMNPLRADEIIELRAGSEIELSHWVYFESPTAAGKYRSVLYYANEPALEWHGFPPPLELSETSAVRGMRRSTPIALVSNEVVVEVTE